LTERVPTGIGGLDSAIEGGFPRGSLILLAGNPGTGKTSFAAQFLLGGAESGEPGVYVSFAEKRETLLENLSRQLGRDLRKFEEGGELRVLDMATVKEEALPATLEAIVNEIQALGAKRLVIDSFTAMAQAFEEPIEARAVVHSILSKLIGQLGCTTLMISEVPTGSERIGLGLEEFVADGLIVLRRTRLEDRPFRELEIAKLRGTRLAQEKMVFTLEGGFRAFPTFEERPIEKRGRFQPIPDPPGKFSSGCAELDRILGGGYERGSTILLEVEHWISTIQYQMVISPTIWNFLSHGRAVIIVPSPGVDHLLAKRRISEGAIPEATIDGLLRICVQKEAGAKEEPCIFKVEGKDIWEDHRRCSEVAEEFAMRGNGPVLSIVGIASLVNRYGFDQAVRVLNTEATKTRGWGGLTLLLLKPSREDLRRELGAIADAHLKMIREHGVPIIYGLKPRTGLYAVEMDASKGYPMPSLTPIL